MRHVLVSLALLFIAQVAMCFLHGFYILPRAFRALHFVAMALAIAGMACFVIARPRERRFVAIGAMCYGVAVLVDVAVLWREL